MISLRNSVSPLRRHAKATRVFCAAAGVMLAIAFSEAQSAFEYERGSLGSFALGGGIDLQEPAALDLLCNPALEFDRQLSADAWGSRLYNMSEYELGAGAIALNVGCLTFGGAAIQLTGSQFYWERESSVVFAGQLMEGLRCGMRLYRREIEFAEGYGRFSLTGVSIGGTYGAGTRLKLGVAIENLNRPRYSDGDNPAQISGRVDICYQLHSRARVVMRQQFSAAVADRFSIGQRIDLFGQASLLVGVGTNPTELGGGVSFDFLGFKVEYGYRDNVYLGGTHRVGMTWSH